VGKVYITFFHNSQYNYFQVPSLFQPKLREDNKLKNLRPAFYWFNDRWHSHLPKYREKYFYLFVKNPREDNIRFRSRHIEPDFNGLYAHYAEYLKERSQKNLSDLFKNGNHKEYCEPSILMSFSDIEPDLVLSIKHYTDRCGRVVKPKEYQGMRVCLFDKEFFPIKFINIPEIVKIIPKIKESYPFLSPETKDGEYLYEDWTPLITEKMGMWI